MSGRLVCSIDTSWMDGPPRERQGHCIFKGNELIEAKEHDLETEQEKQMTKRHPAVKQVRTFDTGATRDTEEGKLDYDGFLSPLTLRRYAEYMHQHRKQSDGKIRDSDNWQKGIPLAAYLKSLWRHLIDLWTAHRGDHWHSGDKEEALCAIIFNASGYLHELLKTKEPVFIEGEHAVQGDGNWLGLKDNPEEQS